KIPPRITPKGDCIHKFLVALSFQQRKSLEKTRRACPCGKGVGFAEVPLQRPSYIYILPISPH
ncbi:MAG: hypothetical protein KAW19_05000, partial [Candidatus Aminicenantes bacterium]|nr:hypothetical protein [Candidatus Aminicenantes bacterium]